MSVFDAMYSDADEAGMAAVRKLTVVPMIVGTAKDLFSNEIDRTKPVYFVEDGPCGFAWVNIKPGTSAFAKWLVKNQMARKDSYYGGVTVWVSQFNQSMQKKEAYAYAFAEVLRTKYGFKAYASSRMD